MISVFSLLTIVAYAVVFGTVMPFFIRRQAKKLRREEEDP